MKPCPVCAGSGYEYVWRTSPATVIRCTECDGAGEIETELEGAA
jgi:DnaJ-class molecular chaperone